MDIPPEDIPKRSCIKEFLLDLCEKLLLILAKKGYLPDNWISVSEFDKLKVEKAECEICLDFLLNKPIHTCKTCYNLICASCAENARRCPFCEARGPNFSERNVAIEIFIEKLRLPCKNRRFGCNRIIDKKSRAQHDMFCRFKPMYCLYSENCNYHGKDTDVLDHLRRSHQTILVQASHVSEFNSVRSKIKNSFGRALMRTVFFQRFETLFSCEIEIFPHIMFFYYKLRDKSEKLAGKRFGIIHIVCGPLKKIKHKMAISLNHPEHSIKLPLDFFLPETGDGPQDRIVVHMHIVAGTNIPNFNDERVCSVEFLDF